MSHHCITYHSVLQRCCFVDGVKSCLMRNCSTMMMRGHCRAIYYVDRRVCLVRSMQYVAVNGSNHAKWLAVDHSPQQYHHQHQHRPDDLLVIVSLDSLLCLVGHPSPGRQPPTQNNDVYGGCRMVKKIKRSQFKPSRTIYYWKK